MPNHITNILQAPPEVIRSLRKGKVAVDFNTVVPKPDCIGDEDIPGNIEDWAKVALGITTIEELGRPLSIDPAKALKEGRYGDASAVLHRSNVIRMLTEGPFPKDFSDELFELLLRYMRALKTTGFANWHDWSCRHWGTKWNAYAIEKRGAGCVKFETAWSAPMPVIVALSAKFPKATIELRYADEDFGCNLGLVRLVGGDAVFSRIFKRDEFGGKEAMEFALQVIHGGEVPDHMERKSDGELVYKDD